jgi:hypothetical protein
MDFTIIRLKWIMRGAQGANIDHLNMKNGPMDLLWPALHIMLIGSQTTKDQLQLQCCR